AYEKNGQQTTEMPYDTEGWAPVYRDFPGWNQDITSLTSTDQFPKELKDYIHFIEEETGTPITIVSVGPDREQTISR
ncbi:MAG: adenylosuccinate synthetase, partial [Bacteroidales bacterium]|nr:adenylosuccinate synthetase [Bacteroidales bacterium]